MSTPGLCTFCGCSDTNGCEGGCAWANEDHTLCSYCAAAIQIAQRLVEIFGKVAPRARPPIALPAPSWDDLILDQQQLLVMACRRTVEAFKESLLEEMTADGIGAMLELHRIGDFLAASCPEEIREDETRSEAVARLLGPHVGSRIVLPGVRG